MATVADLDKKVEMCNLEKVSYSNRGTIVTSLGCFG
jgi:hypothetical protein